MNYLDIKKDLEGFWKELGYRELIKGLIAFELDEENEKILEELYERYSYDDCQLINEKLVDKYEELLKGGEE